MSGHAGARFFDDRPIDPELLRAFRTSLSDFGPDRSTQYVAPGIGMVHCALHVTPEDRTEIQPFVSRRGHVMTWDGRLDNRDELRCLLWREVERDTDVELAMAVYETEGHEGLRRLVGDWSLVLWDADERTFIAASDYAGTRALYYAGVANGVIWASSLRVLLERTDCWEVSVPFVVGYVTATMPPGLTPYSHILAVPPGHALVWKNHGELAIRRFWDFSERRYRFSDARDYAQQLRSLFREAVACRMRSHAAVWAEQSGGLDSSAIVCMADQVLKRSDAAAPDLHTVSYSSNAFPIERGFIRAVEEHCQRRTHDLSIESCYGAIDPFGVWITPFHPGNVALHEFALVRGSNAHVLLSGHPGDAVMGNAGSHHLDVLDELLRERRPIRALGMLRHWSRATERPIWQLVGDVCMAVAPLRVKRAHATRAALGSAHRLGGNGLRSAFCSEFLLGEQHFQSWYNEMIRRVCRLHALGGRGQPTLLRKVVPLVDSGAMQAPSEYPRVLLTAPYTHRPLVEYVLGLPASVVAAPGQPRLLMKQAFEGLLPERVLHRFSKGQVVEPHRRRAVVQFARTATLGVNDLHLVRLGVANAHGLRLALESVARHGVGGSGALRRIVQLEMWLGALANRREYVSQRSNASSVTASNGVKL